MAGMQAVRFHQPGGPRVLRVEEITVPIPGRDEVLVEVLAGSVNPVDAKIRSGKFPLWKPKLPAIPGRDVAGIVRAVGPHGGRGTLRLGDAVFGMLDYRRGAYAEFAIGSERELARIPRGLSLKIAGVLGVAAQTAWQGLFDHGKLRRGQRVLIHGGAGGVGHLAVQFAKLAGATVIATASGRDRRWLQRLGAAQVIDYAQDRFENLTGNIDLVFDLIGGETQDRSWQVLKERGGRIVSTRSKPSPLEARQHRATGMVMAVTASPPQLARIGGLIVEKKVVVKIGRSFALREIRAAHALIENGHVRGKIALRVRG